MKLTTDDHKDGIEVALAGGASYAQIAEAIGCGKDSVRKFVKQHLPHLARPANGSGPKHKPSDPVDERELLEAELKELRSAAKRDRQEQVIAERLLAEIREITPEADPTYEPPTTAEGEGHRHAHVLLLSDLHCGEVVNAEAMNGLGEFDFEILKRRMAHIAEALVSFQNNRPYPIEQLRIWNLGDLVGGEHHEEYQQTNEFGPIQQAWRTGMLLGQFIEPLVEAYPSIHVTGISGNHARLNRKPQTKRVFESFDWLAQSVSELYLRAYPTVTHSYPLAGMTTDTVAGKTVLLGHGDMVRSSMPGVPWGGVIRRFNELRKTYAQRGILLDYFALGHFHQPCVVPGIFMNGSVKGPDEHVLKAYGTAEPPCQLLLTFDLDRERLTDVSYINPK